MAGVCQASSSQLRRLGSINKSWTPGQDRPFKSLPQTTDFHQPCLWSTISPKVPPARDHMSKHTSLSHSNHLALYTAHLQCCSTLEIFYYGFEFWLHFSTYRPRTLQELNRLVHMKAPNRSLGMAFHSNPENKTLLLNPQGQMTSALPSHITGYSRLLCYFLIPRTCLTHYVRLGKVMAGLHTI